jgi:2-oxoglutarate dehydrogenase E1 component
MSVKREQQAERVAELIADEFGVNAGYVADLFQKFSQDAASIDDEWRSYFEELIEDGHLSAAGDHSVLTRAVVTEQLPTALATELKSEAAQASQRLQLRGAPLRLAENMQASLGVPTATSQRQVPLKLLDENRRLMNQYLAQTGNRVSFTVLIARAVLAALERFPQLNDSYDEDEGIACRVRNTGVSLGIAVDAMKKDGTRTLLVPNIKNANTLSFPLLMQVYDETVLRAREGRLSVADFQGTTVSITNPGTLGTTASNPRLMSGQGLIVATGAIDYPPEFQAMTPESLSRLGITKVMTITSTYDHRIIQGAESGSFLALVDELLRGKHHFYDDIFRELGIPFRPYTWAIDRNPALLGEAAHSAEVKKQARVFELINAYRVRGHLISDIDPLRWKELQYHPELDIETYDLTIWDLDREFVSGGLNGQESAKLREILEQLRRFYCRKVGVEYRHIQSPEEKEWIRARVEQDQPAVPASVKKQILWKLISAELFEKFLGAKYLGQKRFSIEGAETIVAVLDHLIESAAALGVRDITVGMSHRGRLNVIANVIGRFCERIFASFEGSIHPRFPHDQGDVKYHQGADGIREAGEGTVAVSVLPNPSHLEFVDPVVEGVVRAKQDLISRSGDEADRSRALAVLVHGDAAFAGEGIVAETLNLSQLPGYRTRGTIHIIVNNQVGFTTLPEEGRSSTYSTDVAKMIQAPIFHVNGDDPEAACNVLRIALDYRQRFRKDVVIDLIGFRRHGHNEGDEPTYTQPVMYRLIRGHPGVRHLYAQRLINEGLIDEDEVAALMEDRMRRYENARLGAIEIVAKQNQDFARKPSGQFLIVGALDDQRLPVLETAVEHSTLKTISAVVTSVPKGFVVNPKITGLLARRAKMVEGELPVDWGMAETLALGSLVLENVPVRLTGEDTERGTFSQRHSTLHDNQTGEAWTALAGITPNQAPFEVYDSPLSEAGALGFEYGYSIAAPNALVLWEAQFGDFVNAAQVIVDQFIAAGEEKWSQLSGVVLLLPHGYEGQGPEHSSARLERFLSLCAKDNIQVASCSTSAQYFHVLRRQAKLGRPKPLVLMTPKSLLRSADASSKIELFTSGRFEAVLGDSFADESAVRRVLLCTGKICHELAAKRKELDDSTTAIVRVELLNPFPAAEIGDETRRYAGARDIRWVQEEPANMGAWPFLEPRLHRLVRPDQRLVCIARPAAASTATGSHTIHQMEQQGLIEAAFSDAE